jgi:hypothetical protein
MIYMEVAQHGYLGSNITQSNNTPMTIHKVQYTLILYLIYLNF